MLNLLFVQQGSRRYGGILILPGLPLQRTVEVELDPPLRPYFALHTAGLCFALSSEDIHLVIPAQAGISSSG